MNTHNFIKNLPYLLVLLLSTACGRGVDIRTKGVNVDPQFSSYVQAFQDKAKAENHPVVIDSLIVEMQDKLDPGVLGVCWTDTDPSFVPKVQISKEYWNMIDNYGKQELIFHELGHCVLGRAHRADEDTSSGIPLSIMNPYFIASSFYTANSNQYFHELFLQQDVPADLPMKAASSEALHISRAELANPDADTITTTAAKPESPHGITTSDGKVWFCGNDKN